MKDNWIIIVNRKMVEAILLQKANFRKDIGGMENLMVEEESYLRKDYFM